MLSFLKTNEDHKQKTNEDYKPTKINSNFNTELAAKVAVENERFANLPPVRECGVVEFSFSERQFPAPKRESNKGGLISVRTLIRFSQMAVHLTVVKSKKKQLFLCQIAPRFRAKVWIL